jgi:hypothetical protein
MDMTYSKHNNRWYHKSDVHHTGPSVSMRDFHRGARPPVTAQVAQAKLKVMSASARRQIAVQALTVGVPKMPSVLDEVVRIQRERGQQG